MSLGTVQAQTEHSKGVNSATALWEKTVGTVLKDPLWNTRDAYDSGHILMVPLHYAFIANDKNAVSKFEDLFSRSSRRENPYGQLNQVHWLYLVSRYLALKIEFDYPLNPADEYLVKRLSLYIHIKWLFDQSFQWDRIPFAGTKLRLDYIQSKEASRKRSYYIAVTDFELYLFSIASDLRFVLKSRSSKDPHIISKEVENTLAEVTNYAVQVLRSRGSFTSDGGWLFQQGIWDDHPDRLYSGHLNLGKNLEPKKNVNGAEDSSHSHRWPLWLRSIYLSQSDSSQQGYLLKVIKSLSFQFNNYVAVINKDSGYLTLNNFMDGHNGIYRYRYVTVGSNAQLGYGQFGLSGILGQSWYPFLLNVDEVYKEYSESYPLPEDAINLYVGPNTTRKRNPLFQWPDFFTNGFAELIALQSYYLASNYSVK
jgi:hypothetical protein